VIEGYEKEGDVKKVWRCKHRAPEKKSTMPELRRTRGERHWVKEISEDVRGISRKDSAQNPLHLGVMKARIDIGPAGRNSRTCLGAHADCQGRV